MPLKSVMALEINLNQPESLLKGLKITALGKLYIPPQFSGNQDCIKPSIQGIIMLFLAAIEHKYL